MKKWYYYLHTNGDLIGKSPFGVECDPNYFDSPFVKKVWEIDLENRLDAWNFILEALSLGAGEDKVKELVEKWDMTKEDCLEYISRQEPTPEKVQQLHLFVKKIYGLSKESFTSEIIKIALKKSK